MINSPLEFLSAGLIISGIAHNHMLALIIS